MTISPPTRALPARPALVTFDLDGTLVDTAPDLADAVDETMRSLGLPARGEDKVRCWIGNGAARLMRRAITDGGEGDELDDALVDRALQAFLYRYRQQFTGRSRLYPGAIEVLEALHARGTALACITNKPFAFVEPLFAAMGLSGQFGLTLGGESLPRKKPDPLPFTHTLAHFGVEAAETLHVGDSQSDVRAAKAAGVFVVAVTYGYNHGRDIRETSPDALIDDLRELLPLLQLD